MCQKGRSQVDNGQRQASRAVVLLLLLAAQPSGSVNAVTVYGTSVVKSRRGECVHCQGVTLLQSGRGPALCVCVCVCTLPALVWSLVHAYTVHAVER